MDLISWFSGVIAFGVSLPLEEILKLSGPPMISMGADLLHFIFFFALNEVRWWLGKVWAVSSRFVIGR
jgi:hypothetical protein